MLRLIEIHPTTLHTNKINRQTDIETKNTISHNGVDGSNLII